MGKLEKKASASSPKEEKVDPVPEYKLEQGIDRAFVVTTPDLDLSTVRSVTSTKEKILLAALGIFATAVRFHALSTPDSVVFDEVHFGGFARKYILGKYFMDVHPPLTKMLYACVGYLFGYSGSFPFKSIGDVFPSSVPYVAMRSFPAILSVGTVLFCYLTLRASGCRIITALLTSVLLTLENFNATLSRYILLDSPLLFFIAAAVYSLKRFENEIPFSVKWYKSLFVAGVALGCALSSKWVGLFTIAWAGCYMVWQMWFILGDLTLKPRTVVGHFISRASILLLVPFTLYCLFFAIHFNILSNDDDGSAFMSSAFRSTLKGNLIPQNTFSQVGVGSEITIRHVNTQGGYLHSHDHLYETGSKQQQITLYPHLDENNVWIVELYNVSSPPTSFEQITDGTKIRLRHKLTHRRLHSHNHRPPISEQDWQNEASCYGFEGFQGDANDDFIVEIVKSESKKGPARSELRAIDTIFKLRHAMTGCYLFSHEVKLPKYAFEQQEVSCAGQGVRPLTLWYVETNRNEFLDSAAERVSYKKLNFWDKFVEAHKRMWSINNKLTASHAYESRPLSWPTLKRGINYWQKNHRQVYLIGNFITWYASSAVVFLYLCSIVALIINWQRGKPLITDRHFIHFNVQTLIYVGGWALHLIPFYLMGRQLFLHHYMPSLYFQILALGQVFDLILTFVLEKKPLISYSIFTVFLALSSICYYNYYPLVYGGEWTKLQCERLKILGTWDFDCSQFPENLAEYATLTEKMPAATTSPAAGPPLGAAPAAGGVPKNAPDGVSAAQNIKGAKVEMKDGKKIIRKYQDENGNLIDADIAEKYLKQHPENILKVETQVENQ